MKPVSDCRNQFGTGHVSAFFTSCRMSCRSRHARPSLDRQRTDGLDLIVATHTHAGHIGGFLFILGEFAVSEDWFNGQMHTTQILEP